MRGLDFAPRSLRSAARQVETAQAQLESRLGRPADEAETARALGITPAELASLKGRVHTSLVLSLDAPGGADGEDPGAASARPSSTWRSCSPSSCWSSVSGSGTSATRSPASPTGCGRSCRATSSTVAAAPTSPAGSASPSHGCRRCTDALKLMRAGLEAQYAEPHRARRAAEPPAPRAGAYAAAVASRSSFLARLAPEPPQRQARAV